MAKTNTISQETLPNIKTLENISEIKLANNANHYLLLEGDLNKDLYEDISAIEFKTFKRWIYEDTEFDDEKDHGPLLVELDEEKKLLEYFCDTLIKQHMGVIITTDAESDQLIQHILDLRYVTLPKDESNDPQQEVMFRWYEPRQLAGLLSGFSEKELSYFMQPIQQISWCEWAFDKGLWYQANKPKIEDIPALTKNIKITKIILNSMNKQDERYFVREITRELIDEHPSLLEKGSEEELSASIFNQTRLAIDKGINRRDDIKEHIYSKLNA